MQGKYKHHLNKRTFWAPCAIQQPSFKAKSLNASQVSAISTRQGSPGTLATLYKAHRQFKGSASNLYPLPSYCNTCSIGPALQQFQVHSKFTDVYEGSKSGHKQLHKTQLCLQIYCLVHSKAFKRDIVHFLGITGQRMIVAAEQLKAAVSHLRPIFKFSVLSVWNQRMRHETLQWRCWKPGESTDDASHLPHANACCKTLITRARARRCHPSVLKNQYSEQRDKLAIFPKNSIAENLNDARCLN